MNSDCMWAGRAWRAPISCVNRGFYMSQHCDDPAGDVTPEVAARIRLDAIARVGSHERDFDLYMSRTIRVQGETLGPEVQGITLDDASALVFVDQVPSANFGHACQYLLYEPEMGRFRRAVRARFPPYARDIPRDFELVHQHAYRQSEPLCEQGMQRVESLSIAPAAAYSNRYAILFSGLPYLRHVNELELCYRTLIQTYEFDPANIFVLLFNGTLRTVRGPVPPLWPGTPGGSPYQLEGKVNDAGTLTALAELFAPGTLPLQPNDLLFIHMTGDGDCDSDGAFINACDGVYRAKQMAADLQGLPAHRALLVLMEQCSSGGFADAVVANAPAEVSTIAAAAKNGQESYCSQDPPYWNYFAAEWLSAHAGVDVMSGAPVKLVTPPALVDADTAYAYAVKSDPLDTPTQVSARGGGNITLG